MKNKLTPKQIAAIPAQLNAGASMMAVAKKHHVSEQCIYYWVARLRKLGVEIHTRSQGKKALDIPIQLPLCARCKRRIK